MDTRTIQTMSQEEKDQEELRYQRMLENLMDEERDTQMFIAALKARGLKTT